MTKRFGWDSALDKVYDYDKPCAGTFISYHEWEIVDLLNDLNDENEELKSENQYLKSLKWNKDCINEISIGMQQRQSLERQNNKLVKEKEQLKFDALYWSQNAEARLKEIDKLRKEKEQLKKQKEWCRNKVNTFLTKTNELNDENKELKEFKQQVITLIDNNIEKLNNTDTVSLIPRESIMVLERLKKVIDNDRE